MCTIGVHPIRARGAGTHKDSQDLQRRTSQDRTGGIQVTSLGKAGLLSSCSSLSTGPTEPANIPSAPSVSPHPPCTREAYLFLWGGCPGCLERCLRKRRGLICGRSLKDEGGPHSHCAKRSSLASLMVLDQNSVYYQPIPSPAQHKVRMLRGAERMDKWMRNSLPTVVRLGRDKLLNPSYVPSLALVFINLKSCYTSRNPDGGCPPR